MQRASHRLHYLAALAALPAAAAVALHLGDARGAGVALGAGLAVAISIAGWVAEARSVRSASPGANAALTAFALTFLVKLFAVAIGAVCLRLNETLAAVADWRAYLLGFAAAVAWVLFIGSFRRFGAARAPKEAPASC